MVPLLAYLWRRRRARAFKFDGRGQVSRGANAAKFRIGPQAHPPRQFEIQFRLHAEMMRV
jgi:hypothetical protein